MAPNGGSSVNYESHPLIPVFGELRYVAARVSVLAYPLLALHAIEPLAKTSPSSRRMSLVPADWRSLGRTPLEPAASRSRHSRPHGIADHPLARVRRRVRFDDCFARHLDCLNVRHHQSPARADARSAKALPAEQPLCPAAETRHPSSPRALRSTGGLDRCITWTFAPRRMRKRASQKPS